MKSFRYLLLLIAAISLPTHAYELVTHGRLTYEAYKRSVLKPDSDLLKDFGIKDIATFGTGYYDISGDQIIQREKNDFEQSAQRMLEEVDPISLPGWLLRGAIREDDVLFPDNGQPVDDPYNSNDVVRDNRVLHHFYDPVNNQALSQWISLSWIGIKKAPDWAIGSEDTISDQNSPESYRRNHFTIFDAREAMYRALTGKSKGGQDVAPTKDDRNKYWATLFRALGDIAHLVEDMAQPQHTRNDPHAGKKYDGNSGVLGHKSVYESYIEFRATGGAIEVPGGTRIIPNNLIYDGYATPHFADYLSYFTTRHKNVDILTRQGLADYSNRGFFSAGTNIESENNVYTLPNRNPAAYTPTSLYVDWHGESLGNDPNAKVTILQGSVTDSLPGGQSAANIPLTTYGAWDQFLRPMGKNDYSLNRYNYDAMADLLIPRAVAYSTGLIDYFFRGRIEAENAHYTDTGIELRLKNAIDPGTAPTEWRNEAIYVQNSSGAFGTLRIAYEYKDSQAVMHYGVSDVVPLAVDTNSPNADRIEPGMTSHNVYSFNLTIPTGDVHELKYRLVFRGRLGQEDDAIAVGIVNPISNFVLTPYGYVPADGITGARTIYNVNNQWNLSEETGKAARNIDWKGWYENGKPTQVLSWVGPRSRYFPSSYRYWGDPNYFETSDVRVFKYGDVFALAPRDVLGAALTRDSAGKEWLVVICRDFDLWTDIVYRRPNKKSNSQELYDPVNQPEGWQEIGKFTHDLLLYNPANTPWFFNGKGTEAQTMRSGYKPGGEKMELLRLKITITDNTATFSNEGNLDAPIYGAYTTTRTCDENYSSLGGCSNCSGGGSTRRQYNDVTTVQGQGSGSYIVAVDYVDEAPVYATYSDVTDFTYTRTIKQDSTSNYICYTQNGHCYSDVYTSSTAKDVRDYDELRNIVRKLNITGFGDIVIESIQGHVLFNYTNTDDVIGKSASNDTVSVRGRLRYLDLRYGLYSLYSDTWRMSGQASQITGPGSGSPRFGFQAPYTREIDQSINFQNGAIPFNQLNLAPNTLTTGVDGGEYNDNGCNTTNSSPGAPAPFIADQNTSGLIIDNGDGSSWAVDSEKHLLVFESKLDEFMQVSGNYLSYLTGAPANDLSTVIPYAPQGSFYSYQGIGVIK